MDLNTVYFKKMEIDLVALGEDFAFMNSGTGKYHVLNDAAGAILSRIDGKTSVKSIILQLADIYGVEIEQIEHEVLAFIDKLVKESLVNSAK